MWMWELGHAEKAKEYQGRAARWFQGHRAGLPGNYIKELTAFRAEAEACLSSQNPMR